MVHFSVIFVVNFGTYLNHGPEASLAFGINIALLHITYSIVTEQYIYAIINVKYKHSLHTKFNISITEFLWSGLHTVFYYPNSSLGYKRVMRSLRSDEFLQIEFRYWIHLLMSEKWHSNFWFRTERILRRGCYHRYIIQIYNYNIII